MSADTIENSSCIHVVVKIHWEKSDNYMQKRIECIQAACVVLLTGTYMYNEYTRKLVVPCYRASNSVQAEQAK